MTATREMLESFRKDKAVKDNIVESWVCVDCGVNTAPGVPGGPQTRIDVALHGKSEARFDGNSECYMVKEAVWRRAGMPPWGGCLCVGCIEIRLGRQLRPKDFSRVDREVWAEMPCTERLLNRRGGATVTVITADGPREVVCALEDAPLIAGKFVEL
jgi:hypothetical protein